MVVFWPVSHQQEDRAGCVEWRRKELLRWAPGLSRGVALLCVVCHPLLLTGLCSRALAKPTKGTVSCPCALRRCLCRVALSPLAVASVTSQEEVGRPRELCCLTWGSASHQQNTLQNGPLWPKLAALMGRREKTAPDG